MSDMLNERFEELVKEQSIVLEAGDPMPSVSASVIPGEGKDPTQISDVQTAKAGGKDPMPTVQPGVAIGQKAATDLGGTSTTPHEHDDDGEENPGAKAAAPIGDKATQSDGSAQTANIHDPGDQGKTPSVGAEVAYGTSTGPAVTYPIKPSYEELDMSDDINALTEGTELSEDFKEKAKTIFESAVKSKLDEEYKKLEEHFKAQVEEQVAVKTAELSEEVKGIVNYGVQRWIEENQVAVDRGLRNEITEDFIAGLQNLFKEHYINIPEEQETVVEGMADEIREMEARINEEVERNIELNNRLSEQTKLVTLNKISEGLADTQKEKLASLAEGVKFESEEQFTKAVKTLRQSYFPESVAKSEAVDDQPADLVENTNPEMDKYVEWIQRWN
jgi:hypothetical protein